MGRDCPAAAAAARLGLKSSYPVKYSREKVLWLQAKGMKDFYVALARFRISGFLSLTCGCLLLLLLLLYVQDC